VYKLVQDGVLERIGRGTYILGEARHYKPETSLQLKKLFNKVHKNFPFVELSVWNSSVLNEFMIHQPFQFLLF
jgi:hypothetical protein